MSPVLFGAVAVGLRDIGRARGLWEEALTLHREVGDPAGEAMSLNNLGHLLEVQGDYQAARSLYEQACRLCGALGDRAGLIIVLGNLASVVSRQGDLPEARSILAEELVICRNLRERRVAASGLEDLGGVELLEARYARAGQLLGAATALREQIGAPLVASQQADVDRYLAALREALSEADLAAALAAGRAMDWEQAITYALRKADG